MSPLWGSQTRPPLARSDELIVEELRDELLVYDQHSSQVHCLSPDAGRVWRACDGETSVKQLGSVVKLPPEVVDRALQELAACDLLDGDAARGVTRREATTRLARVGAAAVVAPLIYSIAAPPPALALTACGSGQFGCQGTNGTTKSCTTAGLAQCRLGGCACCYVSPNQCNHTTYTACVSGCGGSSPCSITYVATACSAQSVCTGSNTVGCQT